jgi:metal-dependent amidase/aminoacylase/carboxypeptidase family protein
VALYRNGPGLVMMVRTDLDALPMKEKAGRPYASKVKSERNGRATFVTHGWGHDIHMASWLGAARILVALKDQWKGTLMFVGQPVEETVSGAKAMIAGGLFTRFPKADFVLALHTSPSPYGFVGYRVGAIISNADSLEITFKGRGGYGSGPDKTPSTRSRSPRASWSTCRPW